MKVFYSDHFVLPLPEGHRFPMVKYSMLRERVATAGICEPQEMCVPHPVSDEEILRAHDRDYLRRVVEGRLSPKEVRRIGFPWSARMVERSRRASGGTLGACLAALEDGLAANLAGGTHHAFADQGEGYCVFNDSAIAARAVQAKGLAERVVVLDTDVHQGNGTAAILRGDPSVFTFSIHGARNFPFRKEESDLDIPLPDGADDGEFLEALEGGLEKALEASRAELAIYLAGADPYEDDRLGRLSVSKEGLAARDRLVLETCREHGIAVAVTMAGGYARKVEDTVDIHFRSIERAASLVNGKRAWQKEIPACLLSFARDWLDPDPAPRVVQISISRWRYSWVTQTHPESRLVVSKESPLLFACDAFGEAKVEAAALSGLAAAGRLLGSSKG